MFRRTTTTFKLLLLLLALAHGTSTSAEGPTESYYSIIINDALVGYAQHHQSPVEQDGQSATQWKAKTYIKVAMLGDEKVTEIDSTTVVPDGTTQPIAYQMRTATNSAVHHVRSEVENGGKVSTWHHRDGDDAGGPQVTVISNNTLFLGNNIFSHWQLILDAAQHRVENGKCTLPIYLPDAKQTTSFELTQGTALQVELNDGTSRTCVPWEVQPASIRLLADELTGQFIRLELAAQKTVVELCGSEIVKQVQKAVAEEILASHFAPSNVRFDNPLKVEQMTAKIDVRVIGSGVENDSAILSSKLQAFDGTKESDRIRGTVDISTIEYSPSDSEDNSTIDDPGSQWLASELYIECDHESIVNQAEQIIGDQKTRWSIVKTIGEWIHKEIAYKIADSPSARLALEQRSGDCGPHSTLMVAMLRSQGIHSRLVGGLVYTPSFGGSFGQHAWVEIYIDDQQGWIAVDPTTGEFERLSATHIKLFEGLGGVLPESVEVLKYMPENKQANAPPPVDIKPLPWKPNQLYTYVYNQGDKQLGSESFSFVQPTEGADAAFRLEAEIKLSLGFFMSLVADTTLTTNKTAHPISFHRNLAAGLQKVNISCAFDGKTVSEKVSGSKNLDQTVQYPPGAYCFDNNFTSSFALIFSQLDVESDGAFTMQTFHPSSLQIIPLKILPKEWGSVAMDDVDVEARRFEVSPIQNTIWVTRNRRLIRVEQGDLAIILSEKDQR